MAKERLMEFMTVADVQQALAETSTAILPSGGTEQHGYHLPLTTDTILACELAKEASRRTGCLVLPPLFYSYSGGLLPGTTDISPETTTQVLVELGVAVAEQGVRHFILLVGHCGGEHLDAVDEAGYRLRERLPELTVAVAPIPALSPTWREFAEPVSDHAGRGETSLLLFLRPDLVREERPMDSEETKRPPRRKWVRDDFLVGDRPRLRRREPNYTYGLSGTDPHTATAELGQRIFAEMAAGLTELVERLERQAKASS